MYRKEKENVIFKWNLSEKKINMLEFLRLCHRIYHAQNFKVFQSNASHPQNFEMMKKDRNRISLAICTFDVLWLQPKIIPKTWPNWPKKTNCPIW